MHYCPRFVRAGNIDPLNLAIRDVRKMRLRDAAIKDGRARLDALFGEQGFNTVIVSNESALGDPFNDRDPGFFPLLVPAAAGLKEMFSGYHVVPMFFVRDQASLLPSFYGQRVRQGASESFPAFVARAQRYDLSWQPVIAAISEAFIRPVELHRFEDFAAHPADYTRALFASYCGAAAWQTEGSFVKNKAAKSHALRLMLTVNNLVDRLIFLKASKRLIIKKRVRRLLFPFFERIKSGYKLQMSPDDQKALSSLYKTDVEALPKKKGPAQENRP